MDTKKFMGDYLLSGMYGEARIPLELPYNEISTLSKGHGRKNMMRLSRIETLLTKGDPQSIQDCCDFINVINKKVNYLPLSSPKYPRRIEQLVSFGVFPTTIHAIMGLYNYKLPVPKTYKRGESVPKGAVSFNLKDAMDLEDYVNSIIDINLGMFTMREVWGRFIRHYPLIKYIRANRNMFGKDGVEGCYLSEAEIKLHENVNATIDTCCHILRSLSYFRAYDGYALTKDKKFMEFMFEMLMDDRHFSCAVYALEEIICCANEFSSFDVNEIIGKRFVEIINSFGPYKFAAFTRVLIQLTYDNEAFSEAKKKGYDVLDRKKRDRNFRPIDVNHAIVMSIPNLFQKVNKLLLSCKCIHGRNADKSVQVIIFESLRKDWDKLREADRMLPESEVFVGDEPTLGRGDLFIPTFMVEIVYTMNTLIRGKRRLEVQQTFLSAKESLVFLNRVIDSAVWLESDPHFDTNSSIKAHVLRLIINLADRFSKHKESFFTEHEIASIKGLKFEENLFLKEPDPEHEEGIIAKLCRILLKINPDSNFSYWIVNILSSLSRGFDARFIYWILEGGVLNTLMKLNGLLEKTDEETITKFLGIITKNIEDSCVFVRHVILTLYNYPEEQAGRLKRITDFYQSHKISLIKIIIENLKIEKLCDEKKYGNVDDFIKTVIEQESKEVIQDYIETLKFWQKYYLNFGMDIMTFEASFNLPISIFDKIRIKVIKALSESLK